MPELMIKIENVSKEYRLGAIGGTTLREDLARLGAKIRHKEDPTLKIGQSNAHFGERFLALDHVSFEVNKGEAVGIIGHNGAGKSTLLKLLSRVTAPTSGFIGLNGRIASMLEVGTGFHPELTGRENIYMNGAILGMTRAEIDSKIEEIIDFSECRQFIDTPVKRYSSGMYVKLAFSVAAHLDADIMVMDEVLAVGDMKFQQKCLGKMENAANNEGRTVLYVSHNMNTIRQLCNRCVVLSHGKVIFDGDVEDGISVYMGENKAPGLVNDCTAFNRKGFSIDNKVFIKKVCLEGVKTPLYSNHDVIKMSIYYSAIESMNHLCLRIPVFFSDTTVVGMASTAPEIYCIKGDNKVTVYFKPENLAPGRYYARLVMYSVNEFGTTQTHDVVDEAFAFDIQNNADAVNKITWEHKYWGALQFPQMEIKEEV